MSTFIKVQQIAEIRSKKNIRKFNIQLRITNKRAEAEKQANNETFRFIVENILIYNCNVSVGLKIAALCKTYRKRFMDYIMFRLHNDVKFTKQLEHYAHKLNIRLNCKNTRWPMFNCSNFITSKLPPHHRIEKNALCNSKEKFVLVSEFKRKVFLKYSMNGERLFIVRYDKPYCRRGYDPAFYDPIVYDYSSYEDNEWDEWDELYPYKDIIESIRTKNMKNLPYRLVSSFDTDEVRYVSICPHPIEMKKQNKNEYAKKMKHKQANKKRVFT